MYRALGLILFLAACSGGGGSWPSLARRPIEGPLPASPVPRRCAAAVVPTCGPAPASAPAVVATPPQPASGTAAAAKPVEPAPPVALGDTVTQLDLIERDLSDAATRLAAQRTTASQAAAAARAAGEGSAAWAQAQVETTALERIGNQIGDIRARLDAIAGTLAAAGAGGTDTAMPLAATGRLITRATALQRDYDSAAAALR